MLAVNGKNTEKNSFILLYYIFSSMLKVEFIIFLFLFYTLNRPANEKLPD